MSDLRCEKFERYCKNIDCNILTMEDDGSYSSFKTQALWQAWCAAIESVVVELPAAQIYPSYIDKVDIQDALDKAGIKYE